METTPSANRIKTTDLLRTKGALTGNFGKARVKAGSALLDLGSSNRERIGSLPTQDEYLKRLSIALEKTFDPKLKEFIRSQLRQIQLKRISTYARVSNPQGPYCDVSMRQIASGR